MNFDCAQLRECLDDLLYTTKDKTIIPFDASGDADYACKVAYGAAALAAQLRDEMATTIDAGSSVLAVMSIFLGIVAVVLTGGMAGPAVLAIIAAAVSGGALQLLADITDGDIDDFRCIVFAAIVDEGELNLAAIVEAKLACDDTWSNPFTRDFFKLILDAGEEGLNNAVTAYGIGPADCLDCGGAPLLVHSQIWPDYQEIISLGGGAYTVASLFYASPCWVAGFEHADGISGGFQITSSYGDEPTAPAGCNSNKALRVYYQGEIGYVAKAGWTEIINDPNPIWRVHVFSTYEFTLAFDVQEV